MTFKFEEIHCEKCAARIKKAMESVAGVTDVVVNQPEKTATCNCDASCIDAIKAACDDMGYTVTDVL